MLDNHDFRFLFLSVDDRQGGCDRNDCSWAPGRQQESRHEIFGSDHRSAPTAAGAGVCVHRPAWLGCKTAYWRIFMTVFHAKTRQNESDAYLYNKL